MTPDQCQTIDEIVEEDIASVVGLRRLRLAESTCEGSYLSVARYWKVILSPQRLGSRGKLICTDRSVIVLQKERMPGGGSILASIS